MIWLLALAAIVALVMGGLVDIFDRGRLTSAYGLSVLFAAATLFGYFLLLLGGKS